MDASSNKVRPFGIEIMHSRAEANQAPPDQSARETIAEYERQGNTEAAAEIHQAARAINQVVGLTRLDPEQEIELVDIFTAPQLREMQQRMTDYLGTDIDTHLEAVGRPTGYPFYIGRLAAYFWASDGDVVKSFGAFEVRHTDPQTPNATGPMEYNSREFANIANEILINQFTNFYQTEFNIELRGPTKKIEGGRVSWERGIAECQFLVLDSVRDTLSIGHSSVDGRIEANSMTPEDVEINIIELVKNHRKIVAEVAAVNPILARTADGLLDNVTLFGKEVFHRGKMGVPRYKKEPQNARAAIGKIESLLMQAAALAETYSDQEDIPVLDL